MCKADRMRIEAAAAQRLQQAHAASERKVIGRGDARQLMARHRITQRDPAVAHIGHIGHGATVVQMEVAPQHLQCRAQGGRQLHDARQHTQQCRVAACCQQQPEFAALGQLGGALQHAHGAVEGQPVLVVVERIRGQATFGQHRSRVDAAFAQQCGPCAQRPGAHLPGVSERQRARQAKAWQRQRPRMPHEGSRTHLGVGHSLFLDANFLFTAAHHPGGKAAFLFEAASRPGPPWQLPSTAYAIEEGRRAAHEPPRIDGRRGHPGRGRPPDCAALIGMAHHPRTVRRAPPQYLQGRGRVPGPVVVKGPLASG